MTETAGPPGETGFLAADQSPMQWIRWLTPAIFLVVGFAAGELVSGGDWTSFTDRKKEVLKVLSDQAAAWNRGDLSGFMRPYWNNEQLAFVSGGKTERGWQYLHDRFEKKYFASDKDPGALTFGETEVLFANSKSATVVGQYLLKFKNGTTADGRFTVVFRRSSGEWKIVYDHTSSEPANPPIQQSTGTKSVHQSN